MRPKRSLADTANLAELERRLLRLTPESARRWGTLTPHEMLCHLADAFDATLGRRPFVQTDTWLQRHVVKWVALHSPIEWPKGIATLPELNPRQAGSQPVEFERDRARVADHLRHFSSPGVQYFRHPAFGPMTRAEWLLWGYGHVDHHLRQFDV